MVFNFYDLYKGYSNIELLKIVNQPSAYQNEAVAAATQLLNERNVSDDEYKEADNLINEIAASNKKKEERTLFVKKNINDLLEPLINPSGEMQPSKWLKIFLVIVSLQYAWTLYGIVSHLIKYFSCSYCKLNSSLAVGIVTLLYVPVIFYLLFKRKRWGWILLFADNLFSLILQISQSYIFFRYYYPAHGSLTVFLEPILMNVCFIPFLWRETSCQYFGVDRETKRKTAKITTLIAVSVVVLFNVFFQLWTYFG